MSLAPLAPLLEVCDGFDAADADAVAVVGMREGHLGEAMAEGVGLFEPVGEGFRPAHRPGVSPCICAEWQGSGLVKRATLRAGLRHVHGLTF